MKPAWDQLGAEFANSKTVVIGDVDCTIHKDLCSQYGVRGYPTIKYYTGATAADGDKYEGGRDFKSLKTFVDENLGPSCDNDNRDLCDEEQVKRLDHFSAMTSAERQELITSTVAEIAETEKTFKAKLDELTKTYEQLNKDKEAKVTSLQPDLRIMRAIEASGAGSDGKDEL